MGSVVPSGRVVVADPAIKLTTCWPKPVADAKRRNTLTKTAAFTVVLDLESLIRIMVLASRCQSALDINLNLCTPFADGGFQRMVKISNKASLAFVNRKFP